MKAGELVAVFENIKSDKYTVDEKLTAIDFVLSMPTYNSIKRKSFRDALDWLWNTGIEWADDEEVSE